MNYFYLGSDNKLIKVLTAWAEGEGHKIFDASASPPRSGDSVFMLGDIIHGIEDVPFSVRDDIRYFIFIDASHQDAKVAGSRFPVIWSNANINFQLSLAGRFDFSLSGLSSHIDIKNMVSLPIYSRESYEIFSRYTSYMLSISGADKVTLAVLFPAGRYGVVLSSTENLAFKNYVLFLDSYPEIREVINSKTAMSFTKNELLKLGAVISADDNTENVTVIPLFSVKREILSALIIKSGSTDKLDENIFAIAQNMFSGFLSKIFLFSEGGNNVGGCPFLVNNNPEETCWAAFEIMPEGIIITDRNGKIEFMNRQMEDVLNLERKAFIKKNAVNIFDISLDNELQETKYYHFYSLSQKTLEWLKFELSSSKTGFIVREKIADSNIKYYNDIIRLRDINDSRYPFIVYDIMGTIRFVNREAADMLGEDIGQLEGKANIVRFARNRNLVEKLNDIAKKANSANSIAKLPYLFRMIDAKGNEINDISTINTYSPVHELFVTELIKKNTRKEDGEEKPEIISEDVSDCCRGVIEKMGGAISHNFNQSFSVMNIYLEILEESLQPDEKASKYIGKMKEELQKVSDLARNIERMDIGNSEKYVGETDILKLEK